MVRKKISKMGPLKYTSNFFFKFLRQPICFIYMIVI